MTSALLMLLLSLIKAQSVSCFPSCPASCMVCSDEAVICQRLGYIIDAPQTTQALMLTEGSISTVQPGALSLLRNVTVISLSHNCVSAVDVQSFRNMPFLQTLLLDHNLLTSQALEGGALANLTQLEVLALGNNRINMIKSDLFKGTRSLRILKLEGNQITRLDSGSFPLNGLQVLESLDLSDNFIDYLDRDSFRGLISLTTLDLSRNHLHTARSETFSYLAWLNNLNVDLNSWNCSCQLLELAAFLSAFIQDPDKTLYNGRRIVCVSAANPAVTTVLELTAANCVPSNQNIRVRANTGGSVTPQLYVQDLAITGVVCFAGGVGLTLLIVLIYNKVSKKKKQQSQEGVKEEGSGTVSNHSRNHIDIVEKRKDTQPRTEGNGGQFRCPDCRGEELAPNPVRWERMNGRAETLEDRERQRIRVEEERRRAGPQQRMIARDAMNKHLIGNSIDAESQSRQELLHCGSCHRTYRQGQMDQNARQARFHPNMRDTSAVHGFQQQRSNNWGKNTFYSDADIRNLELQREARNVSFNLESQRRGQGQDGKNDEATTPRGKEGRQDRGDKLQSSRSIKVKLNLNPLRKSKVHPKKKGDEKGSPRKHKDKSSDGKGKSKKDKRKSKKSDKDKRKEQQKSKSEQENAGQETVAQAVPAAAMGRMQGLLGAQFRGGGMLLGNRTTNLLGATGPQLPTSSLPFQGGNFMAPGKPMFPSPNTMAPNMNLSGPSMVPSGAPDFMRTPSMGRTASSNSLIANMAQSNQPSINSAPFQASLAVLQNAFLTQASPITLQASATTNVAALQPNTAVQALANLAATSSETPSLDSKSQVSPKGSPRGKANPIQEPQSNNETASVASETFASPRKSSQTPVVVESTSVITAPQSTLAKTMVENMSNTDGEGGVVTQAEGPMSGLVMAGGGTQAADVSVSGVQDPMESADNAASAALIQHEVLSEDGGTKKLRLVIPEKTSNRPPTALERKLR